MMKHAFPGTGNAENNEPILHRNSVPELVIEPGRSGRAYWRDLWRSRELFYILAWRDMAVRYKQTVVGVAWSILRPVLTMVVFSVVFGMIAKLPTEGNLPYPILVFVGLLPWQFFSNALSEASQSLINNTNLISKVYCPRMIIPGSSIMTSFVDLLISMVLLAFMMIYYGVYPGWQIVFLPVFLLLAFFVSFGAGLYTAALNAKYRDFRHIVPFILQAGLYISPVGFSSNLIPEKWKLLYALNPMTGVIDGFRWSLLGGVTGVYLPGFLISSLVILLLLYFSIRYFRRAERLMADFI